eukprot:TRINITY_DN6782_c0_g1_i1.p1 TRINITY_DN6782_c0_g1~~TRINITY_DN6782_c0_g1_i1.p1  ORF type:complete len:428 (+),score=69.64 TRINITY_DN6782_c0_g1_i1:55-1338(+)
MSAPTRGRAPDSVYIPARQLTHLETYAYAGVDLSPLSNYVLQPYWRFMARLLPRWLAPNAVTLLGLLASLAAYAVLTAAAPRLRSLPPLHSDLTTEDKDLHTEFPQPSPWVFYAAALAVFAYQTLDALDGKQARALGMSSPMGELFDHGCDAINTAASMLLCGTVCQMGTTIYTLVCGYMLMLGFFMATWETYHTGTLVLPAVNVPTEGILMVAIICFITGYSGPEIWDTNVWDALPIRPANAPPAPLNVVVVILVVGFGSFMMMQNAWSVVIQKIDPAHPKNKSLRHKTDISEAITQFFPIGTLYVCHFIWYQVSFIRVFDTQPHLFMWIIGLEVSRQVGYLVVCHLCHMHYRNRIVMPYTVVLSVANLAFARFTKTTPYVDEEMCLYACFLIALIFHLHFLVSVVRQFAIYLRIPIFTVPKDKQK